MAFTTATHSHSAGFSFGGLRAAIGRVFSRMIENGAGAQRLRQIEALQAKSDEELAARGLKRDEIVRHVFRDIYFI